ncbi:hypothetical protein COI98_06390 [Bacillus cereus]|uniref:Uncharacterized protein n=1 Tax=Bacillus cereus TaxID=1396 RepID=A0A9X6X3M4_BACCE|nr:hypothetical protein COI98_06390 [Bacillus cereus]
MLVPWIQKRCGAWFRNHRKIKDIPPVWYYHSPRGDGARLYICEVTQKTKTRALLTKEYSGFMVSLEPVPDYMWSIFDVFI